MIKDCSVLMHESNPPHFYICAPHDPRVIESHTMINDKTWSAPSATDPSRRETFAIGESRNPSNSIRGPMVLLVFERRLVPHIQELVRVMQV